MTNLSQNDRNIIAEYPLSKNFDHLQEPLRKAEQNYESGPIPNNDTLTKDQRRQKAISSLLLALMGQKAAFNLRSKIGNNNIIIELSKFFEFVQNGRYNYEHYRTLSRLIVKQVLDVDIWNVVFDFIITIFRIILFTDIFVFFDGISVTSSSVTQQGGEQIRKLMKAKLFD